VVDASPGPERGRCDAAAFTAAGLLSPVAELESGDARVGRLGWRSLQLWPRWLEELQQPVHFERRGSLLLAHPQDRTTARRLLSRVGALSPSPVPEEVDPGALEPSLLPGLLGWQIAGEGSIHAVQAMDGLYRAATAAGVAWQWGSKVDRVQPGRLDDRGFDHVVDARGLGARPDLPGLRGVRGEIFWLQAPGVPLHRSVRLLHPRHRVYLVPRPHDLIVVGASEIEAEDRSPMSVRTALELLGAAHSVLPQLAEARIVHSGSHLRPALPDNAPLLEQRDGLTRINGLHRHGWLAGPALVEQAMEGLA
jgi:glycine oxidase